ncbi:hypothetical protein GCM10027429_19950 [Marivirga atlantica]|jgi:hypothetical protein|uniref:PD-(D/E)XK nuclease superfamily protein n=1 Tax=Marivirga atlantica TaxID=1548457 RepID=A0A937AL85_9BACT|nr:hypothetical protein [Marivirga atlantica]MBL0765613.1 hypothetical protein [Marivirga atlantica]
MNSHLNIFKAYSKEYSEYQLENDLTRALAICLQEDSLFFNDVLKSIIHNNYDGVFFGDLESKNTIQISIQKKTSEISNENDDFEKIYAVSLSDNVMTADHFWQQNHDKIYDPICDIVIKINNVLIIIEAKRDNVDCTAQLYNQAFNICSNSKISKDELADYIIPVDLEWTKLMSIAVNVGSFELATGSPNRFLNDFIELIRGHNFKWLPEPPIGSVSQENQRAIERRIDSAVSELNKVGHISKLDYSGRLGVSFSEPWANELLFKVKENGDLIGAIYPGNTKAQGVFIFDNDPELKQSIRIGDKNYELEIAYHIKFANQGFITGMWFNEKDLEKKLYTQNNFKKYCGRNKREKGDWKKIEDLFDDCFKTNFDWKKNCKWNSKIINTGRTQFNMSFGYEICVTIPFAELRDLDQTRTDLSGLTNLIESIYTQYKTLYKK